MIGYEEFPFHIRHNKKIRFPMYTIAIGDIHGCYDQLLQLMEVIQRNVTDHQYKFVFLGDYIDRGPKSKEVIDYLMKLDNRNVEGLDDKFKHVFLRGNHEDMALNDHGTWMINGAIQTMNSYDDQRITQEHLDWMKSTTLYYKDNQRTYVHAGIVRGLELEEQDPYTMMWIRGEFLNNVSPKGGYVVHGHTPLKEVEMRPNRINLDTGCVFAYKSEGYDLTSKRALSAGIFNELQAEPIMILNHKGEVTVLDKIAETV